MLKFRQYIRTSTIETIIATPGTLNLIIKDIFEQPEIDPFFKNCQFMAEKFKNTRLKQYLKREMKLNADDRLAIPLGVITRWGTHLKLFFPMTLI